MKIRKQMLWPIPLYYLGASWIGFYVLVFLYSSFCTVKTVGADGVINVSINPVLRTIVSITVLLAVFFLGGFWICRKMTRREIALSAGILSAFYFIWVLSEFLAPGWDASISMAYVLMSLNAEVSTLLCEVTGLSQLSSLISCFSPMLFVLFGRNSIPDHA